MNFLEYYQNIKVIVPDPIGAITRIQNSLSKELECKFQNFDTREKQIIFSGGFFRLMWQFDPFEAITNGEIVITEYQRSLTISYKITFWYLFSWNIIFFCAFALFVLIADGNLSLLLFGLLVIVAAVVFWISRAGLKFDSLIRNCIQEAGGKIDKK